MTSVPARDVVRQSVTEGIGRRRARAATRALVRLAPWCAGAALVVALAGRLLFAWPAAVTWAALAVGAMLLTGWFLWLRRAPAVTDVIAASLDADATLGGELRSAYWFSSQTEPSNWAVFHLERAAERLSVVRWADFYPPVRAGRSWALTAVLVAGAVLVTVRLPARQVRFAGAAVTPAGADVPTLPLEAMLPPELRKRLEELLAQIEGGKLAPAEAAAKLQDIQNLLSKIDPNLSAAAGKLARDAEAAKNGEGSKSDPSLAERAQADAQSAQSDDVRKQLEDVASKLAQRTSGGERSQTTQAQASAETNKAGNASAGSQNAESNTGQAAMQLSREKASDSEDGKMMVAGAGSMGGDSQTGQGGKGGRTGGAGAALIAQALRHETIEANTDAAGQNVTTEDIRRKTEQSKSSLGFTHVVAGPTVDPSRTLPPPPVPDARKPLVMQYFIRRQ